MAGIQKPGQVNDVYGMCLLCIRVCSMLATLAFSFGSGSGSGTIVHIDVFNALFSTHSDT